MAKPKLKKPAPPAPSAPPRINDSTRALGAELLNLLHVEPRNPSVRAMVQARTGLAIPPEAQTYEQVITWVECTPLPALMPLRFSVKVDIAEQVRGHCWFEATLKKTGIVEIDEAEIMQFADEGSVEYIFQSVGNTISERADNFAGEIDEDSIETRDREIDDNGDYTLKMDREAIKEFIRKVIRAKNPSRARELGLIP